MIYFTAPLNMGTNAELKELAWKRLWADRWFVRLCLGALLLLLVGNAVNGVLGGVLDHLGVRTWLDYAAAVMRNRMDVTTPVPNLTPEFVSQANSSTALVLFFTLIMSGIFSYGCAVIFRRCLKNEGKGWLGAAFGGFRDPFGLLWLKLRISFIFLIWSLPCLVMSVALLRGGPSSFNWAAVLLVLLIVPFYRYRFVWLVKADHPDWGAGRCLTVCREMMRGNGMRSFRLDCSYWRPVTLALLFPPLVFALTGRMPALYEIGLGVSLYIGLGQSFLYEDLKRRSQEANPGER